MKFLYFLFTFSLLISCTSSHTGVRESKNSVNKIKIEYAKHFNLSHNNNYYILEIIDPISGNVESTYKIDENKNYDVISLTATVNGMYSLLERQNQLKGISNIDYVFDEKIKSLYKQNKIKAFGDETTHSMEKIISSGANTILYSGFGEDFPNQNKLEKLNFTILPIYDWKEIHPLGKAEWIKVIGALTGKMDEAIVFFNNVVKEYNDLKKITENISNKPSCISGNLIGDIWFTPASESYVAHLMKDAGANYRYAETKGQVSLEFSIEQILKDNENTEYWINPGYDSKSKIEKTNPHIKHLKCYKNVYCYSPNMNKFWEQSAAEPNHVLSDLIHIFHPEIKNISSLYYYKKID